MTTTAHEDQFTVAPEPVRQPYDTVAILRRNVADLELALRTQTERAEAAEAELANLAKQEPVAYVKYKTTGGNVGLAWMAIPTAAFYPREGEKLYVTPVPVPHKGATHCDGCGMTWLDDGLNPLGCPYCKDTVPAPAVPSVVFMAHNKTSSILFAARKDADQYAASFGPAAGVSVTECAVIGSQSAPVPAPAVPELDPMNRLIVSDPKQPKSPQQATSVPKEWRDYVFAAADELRLTVRDLKNGFVRCGNCGEQETTSDLDCVSDIDGALELLDGLLQSAPQASAVPAEWREVMSELAADVQAACDAEHPHRDQYPSVMRKYNNDMGIVEKARALLQSAPQAPAVPELDPMTRLIVSDPKQLKPKKQEPAVPADCRQRLRKEGKPYPRSSCAVCGKLSPNWRKCDALLQSEVTK